MSKKPLNEEEILSQLDASLAEDVLNSSYSDADVLAALRAAGGDAEAIGRRGAELAAGLLEKRRLAWRGRARERIERAQSAFVPRRDYSGYGRMELLGMLDSARKNPRLSKPVSQLFHKRKAEDVSDEELRSLLVEVDALALLDEAADRDPSKR